MADPHFGHGNIIKYSGRTLFMSDAEREAYEACNGDEELIRKIRISPESVDRMNDGIISNINSSVQPGDHLYCLGDWSFANGENYVRRARYFRDQINCEHVHLIWGNHDRLSLRGAVNFESCMDTATVEAAGHMFFLSHYPHVSWDKSHKGVLHLYGHVHDLYRDECPVVWGDRWAAQDVGVDVEKRYGAWSDTELVQRFTAKADKVKMQHV